MLEFSDFYDIAKYGNETWKGCFTQKEIACNAYDYFVEYQYSIKEGRTEIISSLIKNLNEDSKISDCDPQVEYWLWDLMNTPLSNKKQNDNICNNSMKL